MCLHLLKAMQYCDTPSYYILSKGNERANELQKIDFIFQNFTNQQILNFRPQAVPLFVLW